MGRYCWMCGRERPNEQFSGRRRKRCVCRNCRRLPRAERERRAAMRDIDGFIEQRNISAKNIARLEALCGAEDEQVRWLAGLVLQVARVVPRRRKRVGYLLRHHRELLEQLVEVGLLLSLPLEEDREGEMDAEAEGDEAWPVEGGPSFSSEGDALSLGSSPPSDVPF